MINLSLKAKKIHNELSFKNLIFKELKWYKNPTYILLVTSIIITIVMLAFIESGMFLYLFFIGEFIIGIILFALFHYINKLKCKKFKFKWQRKGLFWRFPKAKYEKENNKLYYKELISKKILIGNSKDIELLELFEEDINNERIKPIKSHPLQTFVKKGSPIILSIFSIYATLLLEQSKNIVLDSKIVIACTMILAVVFILFSLVNQLILDALNLKYRKQQQFLKRISKLLTSLKIKYHKQK